MNKWYKIDIMKRFMTPEELTQFHRDYNEAKTLRLGQKVVKNKSWIKRLTGR